MHYNYVTSALRHFGLATFLLWDIWTVYQVAVYPVKQCISAWLCMHVEVYCLSFYLNYTLYSTVPVLMAQRRERSSIAAHRHNREPRKPPIIDNAVSKQYYSTQSASPQTSIVVLSVFVCCVWENLQLSCDYDPQGVGWWYGYTNSAKWNKIFKLRLIHIVCNECAKIKL